MSSSDLKVIHWQGKYWLIADTWATGMRVWRSDDCLHWTPQDELLVGSHGDVVIRSEGDSLARKVLAHRRHVGYRDARVAFGRLPALDAAGRAPRRVSRRCRHLWRPRVVVLFRRPDAGRTSRRLTSRIAPLRRDQRPGTLGCGWQADRRRSRPADVHRSETGAGGGEVSADAGITSHWLTGKCGARTPACATEKSVSLPRTSRSGRSSRPGATVPERCYPSSPAARRVRGHARPLPAPLAAPAYVPPPPPRDPRR